ncbi:MAG: 7-cyano-7-deazaguanine synthase QueC [Gammaproteobacteria bacterium]
MKKAVVLLSGGLDSTTCLAYALNEGFKCYTISFDYGQRHEVELHAAELISQKLGAEAHEVVKLSIGSPGGSALTDHNLEIPDYNGNNKIPTTYVPARNTVFLSFALGWAEILEAHSIFIGVSAVDYSGYPDCRPEYIQAFQNMANLATKMGIEGNIIEIATPLIHLNKADTIKLGMKLGVDYSLTVSCYQANAESEACGKCDSCYLRKKGFVEANIIDPTKYALASV